MFVVILGFIDSAYRRQCGPPREMEARRQKADFAEGPQAADSGVGFLIPGTFTALKLAITAAVLPLFSVPAMNRR